MDWSDASINSNYFKVASLSHRVGRILGFCLANLVKYKIVNSCDVHLLGHSIGAHISGIAGRTFQKVFGQQIAQITGQYVN